MVGKRGNKLELFNRQAGTSYPHNDTFNKMLQPPPPATWTGGSSSNRMKRCSI